MIKASVVVVEGKSYIRNEEMSIHLSYILKRDVFSLNEKNSSVRCYKWSNLLQFFSQYSYKMSF